MIKNTQLKALFIEDLGQVSGGYHPPGTFTTLMVGEEGHGLEFGPLPLQRPSSGGDFIFFTAGSQVTAD